MATLHTEKGAALVTAILLTLLSLVISTTLLYTVTESMKVSASHKRYRNALAAAHGGIEVFMGDVVPDLFDNKSFSQIQSKFAGIDLRFTDSDNKCMQQKISLPTSQWSYCAAPRRTADPAVAPDMTFFLSSEERLGGVTSDFQVTTKITDTVPGNTNTAMAAASSLRVPDPVAASYLDADGAVVAPEHVPYLYTLVVQGVREGTSPEKARLSVLYAY